MALEILDHYDAILADLDGTVFEGGRPVVGAADGLANRRVMYVTNNASRAPQSVAAHLTSLGFNATADQVLTSAEAACSLGRSLVNKENATAFVIGADSFKDVARAAGFTVVDSADDHPDVVFQGHTPDNTWALLSEGALAIRRGAKYIASNLDTTLPSERGLMVGNGSMVAAVVSATGVEPVSAGKPGPEMFRVAAKRLGSTKPLVVGDRLDTDIAGGIAAGMDTLCTVTGVSGHRELLSTKFRPTYIAGNMRDHLGGWQAHYGDYSGQSATIYVSSGETSADVQLMAAEAVAAAAPLVWRTVDEGVAIEHIHIAATNGDDAAHRAVGAWR
ncbi:HAD-IIA family hydrolase [Corynebacterium anserum]|uniref:HAD-IIA family hydrolase n=1 Tax=Corynebacterium anserum TaxID=2684406 RepID=A0A7G7YN73_9CORY|nr:HAD-IIA family hydrolase [Corynebacterium anserum]MBC2681485.1 HAD-IIA family hydrolase [Corynebacterium anserum]QNH95943.1 HAD-IIA family hydrolase [Corynebacterium anserum]